MDRLRQKLKFVEERLIKMEFVINVVKVGGKHILNGVKKIIMVVGVPDSKLKSWLKDKDYMIATDEGEAIGIAVGYFLAQGEPATVFMSADGFCNALNPLVTLVIPYEIPIHLVIGVRIDQPQHKWMGERIWKFLREYFIEDEQTRNVTFELIGDVERGPYHFKSWEDFERTLFPKD
jgi:sulfopyruvate decarboxylase TPP-binding subunit